MSLDGTQIAAVSYDTLGRESGFTYRQPTSPLRDPHPCRTPRERSKEAGALQPEGL